MNSIDKIKDTYAETSNDLRLGFEFAKGSVEYEILKIEDKLNEIIEWINSKKDQLL